MNIFVIFYIHTDPLALSYCLNNIPGLHPPGGQIVGQEENPGGEGGVLERDSKHSPCGRFRVIGQNVNRCKDKKCGCKGKT